MVNTCAICNVKVQRYNDFLKCLKCCISFHIECVGLSVEDFVEMSRNNLVSSWSCKSCENITSNETQGSESDHLDSDNDGAEASLEDLSNKVITQDLIAELRSENCKLHKLLIVQGNEIQSFRNQCMNQMADMKNLILEQSVQIRQLVGKLSELKQINTNAGDIQSKVVNGNSFMGNLKMSAPAVLSSDKNNIREVGSEVCASTIERNPLELNTQSNAKNLVHTGAVKKYSTVVQESNSMLDRKLKDGQTALEKPNRVDKHSEYSGQPGSDEGGFITVARRRKKRESNVVIGSRVIDPKNKALCGVEKRLWLYVGRTSQGTTEEAVLDYLKSTHNSEDFTCATLNTKSSYPSFKVSAPVKMKESIEDPSNWPNGIVVRRFNFRVADFHNTVKDTQNTARKSDAGTQPQSNESGRQSKN